MITDTQGNYIRQLRLQLVEAHENNDAKTSVNIAAQLSEYMQKHSLTGKDYAAWNRANPVRPAIRTTVDGVMAHLLQHWSKV